MPPSGFRLDDDHRKSLRSCLKDANPSFLEPADRFFERIEASINDYLRSKPDGTFREAHDAVRAVWKRCQLDPPPVQVLREEVRKLPDIALQSMGRRARIVIPTLFPGESIKDSVSDPPDRLAAGFLAWMSSAEDRKVVEALRALSEDSRSIVAGRSRGGGKRSRAQPEPRIFGEIRGAGSRSHFGGRPKDERARTLVTHLAGNWLSATGEMPLKTRSDQSGFGKLVHLVFQSILVPVDASQDALDAAIDEATKIATYHLRQFWEEVEHGRAITKVEDLLRRPSEG